ncbi:MAG TPA: hypothetical protein VM598_05775, partial [Bdellovibrionota bacterium]|nr:hypothetical protein [Bdellovibrionota bacterium]
MVSPLAAPEFSPEKASRRETFHEAWNIKLSTPDAQHTLWLRFTQHVSSNGFKRVSENWAVYFRRGPTGREVRQIALKQTQDIGALTYSSEEGLRIGDCYLSHDQTRGRIQSKGKSASWDLRIHPVRDLSFNLIPDSLSRSRLVRASASTMSEDLRFSGTLAIDGEEIQFSEAPGMLGHNSGAGHAHSWVWGHSNIFVDEQGKPAEFIFEGLSARARVLGILPSPKISSFFFFFKGKSYGFNSIRDAFRVQSSHTMNEWRFHAEHGPISFRGRASAEHRDFAGVTYEDTNGSLIYCANSGLSDLEVHVYRHGKLDS